MGVMTPPLALLDTAPTVTGSSVLDDSESGATVSCDAIAGSLGWRVAAVGEDGQRVAF